MGGSFNPAHEGHRHVSLEALKRLGLDEVWWLVAPQNPLKPSAGMAPLQTRLAAAKAFARHPRIRVLDLESVLDTRYSADTIAALQALYPRQKFVWLMGADNLAQIRHWRHWRSIFARHRIAPPARRLARTTPPAWTFLPVKLDPSSATAIRSRSGASLRRS